MMRRIAVDAGCHDKYSCPSVHTDDADPDYVVVVGVPVPPGTVPLAPGEVAVRLRHEIVTDAADALTEGVS